MSATSSPNDAVRVARATRPLFGLIWPKGRLRLDRLSRNGAGSTFFPWAKPIPREATNSRRRHPPLRSGPRAGASSIASGFPIAHRGRGGRGLETAKGEV